MGWLSPALVTALAPILAGLIGAVTRMNSSSRKRVRAAVQKQDQLEEWGFAVRHDARVYNAGIPPHADPFVVRPWPDWMTDDTTPER